MIRYKVIKTSRPDIVPVGSTLIDYGDELWVDIPGEREEFYYTGSWTDRENVFETYKDDSCIILVKKE